MILYTVYMNEQEFALKIEDLTKKVDAIYVSAEKTRKYFLWTFIVSIVFFVLPLLALLFAIPSFISSYSTALSSTESTSSYQQQINELIQ